MSKIIEKAETLTTTTYSRDFRWNDAPEAGFSFPCDSNGRVDPTSMAPAAQENLQKCLDGTYNVTDEGVRQYTNTYTTPAILLCGCGETVSLDGFTNTCAACGADYSKDGNLLAPRAQWGEETGEHLGDILRIR
jgi:hypothetical protein